MKGLKFKKEVTQGLGMIYFGCKGTWSLRGAPRAGWEHQAAVSLVILPAPSKCPLCGSVPSARQGASETTLTDWGPGAGQGSVCPPSSFLDPRCELCWDLTLLHGESLGTSLTDVCEAKVGAKIAGISLKTCRWKLDFLLFFPFFIW